MIKKAGVFLPQTELQSNAATMLMQSVSSSAEEPEIIDFKAPSQLAASFRRGDYALAVVAAPKETFLKTKLALIKVLGEKTVRSSAITAAIGEDCPLSDKEIDLHCAVPVNSKSVATADGLFSAFVHEKNGKTVIMLPLIEEKLNELLPAVFGAEATQKASGGFRKNIESVIKSGKKIAVASVGLSAAMMAVVSDVGGGENAFSVAEVAQIQDGNSAERIADAAKNAKENSGVDFGAAVSEIESENGENVVLVCLADSNRARVAKVYAQDGESAKNLAGAAMIKLCEMMEELVIAGALFNPNAPEKQKQKKNPVLPILIATIGIAAAVILSLLVAFFVGEKTESDSVTGGKAHIQADGLAVYAVENETTTAQAEEESNLRGGSGIGDELEFFASEFLGTTDVSGTVSVTETVTEENTLVLTQTTAPETDNRKTTKPEVKTTSAQKTTKPITSTTVKPTVTAPKTTVPATQKPVITTQANKPVSTSGTFVFTSYGWGHGVGMSQEGAVTMAKNGSDYKKILANYYPGTTLKTDSSTPETVKYGGVEYDLIEYLCKTSYREIGNGAPKEAIKAQMVAIYTFAKTYGFDVDSSRHAFSANWAYEGTATYEACLEVLGMESETDTPKAVYVDYNGQPAFTCYFASSAGKTASASSVWGGNYSYLSGGASSPENVEVAEFRISSEDMKKLILDYDETIVLGDDPSQWIKIVSHDGAYNANIGYASVVKVGNKEMRGNHFRSNICDYQLRSHCFTVKFIPD